MLSRRALLAAPALFGPLPVAAQGAWNPTRPIRILVGFYPGGGTDITTRSLTNKLQSLLGQPIIVENRPGGAGNMASEATVNAPADGHTLMMGTIASLVLNPMLSKLSFDTMTDLTPICRSVEVTNVLVAPADRPWQDVSALIAAAKARPEHLTYGSSGVGSAGHLSAALLDSMAGTRTIHVPYRGGGQLITDIVSGKVDFSFATAATVLQHIESGRLRALAVPTPQRSALLPQVPTVAEAGPLPGFEVANWYALMGPRGLPAPIVARINEAMVTTLKDPEVVAHLARHGLVASPSTASELAGFMRTETAKWAPIVRASGASND